MKKTTLIGSLYLIVFTFLIQSGQTLCMKRDEKPEKLQPDFLVSTQLAQRLQEHVNMIKEKRSDKDEKPQTFEETIEKLSTLFCSYKLHRGRFAFNDREVEVYDQNNDIWCRLNDKNAFYVFYRWFNDAAGAVCDTDADVQQLISLASKQLSTVNENNQNYYLSLLMSLPKSVSHRIKEKFAWSDKESVNTPQYIDYKKRVEGMKVKKRKLLLAFKDQTICVYDLKNLTTPLYSFDRAVSAAKYLEKYKKSIVTGNDYGKIALFTLDNNSGPCWKINFGYSSDPRAIKFIDKERIALVLRGLGIQIVASKDGALLHRIHDEVVDLLLLPSSFLVSGLRTIKLYDMKNYQCLATLPKIKIRVAHLLLLDDKILIADNEIMQYDLLGNKEQELFHDGDIYGFAALDSSFIVLDVCDGLRVIDISTKKCRAKIDENYISDFGAFDYREFPGRRILLLKNHASNGLKLWDFPTFEKVLAAHIAKNKSSELTLNL